MGGAKLGRYSSTALPPAARHAPLAEPSTAPCTLAPAHPCPRPPTCVVVVPRAQHGGQVLSAVPDAHRVVKGSGHHAAGACGRRGRESERALTQRGGWGRGRAWHIVHAPSGAIMAAWQALACPADASGLGWRPPGAELSARRSHRRMLVSVEAVAKTWRERDVGLGAAIGLCASGAGRAGSIAGTGAPPKRLPTNCPHAFFTCSPTGSRLMVLTFLACTPCAAPSAAPRGTRTSTTRSAPSLSPSTAVLQKQTKRRAGEGADERLPE